MHPVQGPFPKVDENMVRTAIHHVKHGKAGGPSDRVGTDKSFLFNRNQLSKPIFFI